MEDDGMQDAEASHDAAFFEYKLDTVVPLFTLLYSIALMGSRKGAACIVTAGQKGLRFTIESIEHDMASVAYMKPRSHNEYEESNYTFYAGSTADASHVEIACTVNINDLLDACLLFGSSKQDLAGTSATLRYSRTDALLTLELQRDANIWTQVQITTMDMTEPAAARDNHEEGHTQSQLDDPFLPAAALSTRYEARFHGATSTGLMYCKLQGQVLQRMIEDCTDNADPGECATLELYPDPAMMPDYRIPDGTVLQENCLKMSIGETTNQPTACVTVLLPRTAPAWHTTPYYQADCLPTRDREQGTLPAGMSFRYHARLLAHMLRGLSQLEPEDVIGLRVNAAGMLSLSMISKKRMNAQGMGMAGGQQGEEGRQLDAQSANYVQFFVMPAEDAQSEWAEPGQAASTEGQHHRGHQQQQQQAEEEEGEGGNAGEDPEYTRAAAFRAAVAVQRGRGEGGQEYDWEEPEEPPEDTDMDVGEHQHQQHGGNAYGQPQARGYSPSPAASAPDQSQDLRVSMIGRGAMSVAMAGRSVVPVHAGPGAVSTGARSSGGPGAGAGARSAAYR